MTAEHQLQDAYREWRRLAEAEGEAIRAGNWMLVCDCQTALKELQPRIIRFTGEAQSEWDNPGVDRPTKENHLRETVKSLIELEWRNNSLLDVRRQSAMAEFEELNRARRALRRVQRSYAPAQASGWNSFS